MEGPKIEQASLFNSYYSFDSCAFSPKTTIVSQSDRQRIDKASSFLALTQPKICPNVF